MYTIGVVLDLGPESRKMDNKILLTTLPYLEQMIYNDMYSFYQKSKINLKALHTNMEWNRMK